MLQEEEKVEKYYPHNFFHVYLRPQRISCGLLFMMEKFFGGRKGGLRDAVYRIFKEEFSVSPCISEGQIHRQPPFGIIYGKNGTHDHNRLGISVSKKVGKSVVRSHVTRLIRESYRSMEEEVKSGYDFVVIARVSCAAASYHEVCRSLRHLFKKQQLLLSASERKDRQEKSEAGRKEEKEEGTQ